jgi:glutaredoxin-like YruB-family protein
MLVLILTLLTMNCLAAETGDLRQSPINPTVAPTLKYPMVVLYSTSWCPHCRAAKEYFTKNNIPFINRDVELDATAMDNLTKKYKSQGVPVIVIGKDEKILRGFDQATFEKAVVEVQRQQK